ncbi:MAG: hypothetical protein IJV14_16330 [Lachnospiraceae bacterium]|nr:hypothetical protein [Lachnospiraceae bacterium]MBQ9614131.1 hypothetical protein [Lachnospiraceae bacterium]
MQKPSLKWIILFNLVLDLPMAIVMSVSAALLAGAPVQAIFTPNLLANIAIGFCLAFLLNILIPGQKIQAGFARLFKLDPQSLAGNLVGSLPVCLIFTIGVGLPLSIFNVRKAPDFIFAFFATFIPLYIILYIVAFIFTPLAAKAANAACSKK